MTDIAELDGKNILTEFFGVRQAGDIVVGVNGSSANVGQKVPLSIGGTIQVNADGTVFLDTDNLQPIAPAQLLSDSIIVTVRRNSVDFETNIVLEIEGLENFPPIGQNVNLVYKVPAPGG